MTDELSGARYDATPEADEHDETEFYRRGKIAGERLHHIARLMKLRRQSDLANVFEGFVLHEIRQGPRRR